MESGTSSWEEDMKATYNLNDAVSVLQFRMRPERWYLGQELYLRVRGIGEEDPSTIPVRDEVPIPENAILCGGISGL
ncbi:hypothetical protein OIU78_012835 [Salix suchowensis]|nr:hypothetical protein OIU78_012835 [Salix suchowensis]